MVLFGLPMQGGAIAVFGTTAFVPLFIKASAAASIIDYRKPLQKKTLKIMNGSDGRS